MKVRIATILIGLMFLLVVAGCGNRSPYVGTWNDHFVISESEMIFNGDGTGSASGFIFGSGATFTWREEGDHAVIENWQGRCEFDNAKIMPDDKTLRASGPGGQNPFYREEKK